VHLKRIYEDLSQAQKLRRATQDFLRLLAEAAWYDFIFTAGLTDFNSLISNRYHQERSNPTECLASVEATMAAHEDSQKSFPSLTAEINGTAGIICLEINNPDDTLRYLQDYLVIREQIFAQTNEISAKLAAGYSETAQAMMANGLFSKAKEMLEKSIDLRRQMPKFTELQLFSPLLHLALCYWHERNYDKADNLLLKALRDRGAKFGKDDTEGRR
jgi:tetratricopeptide (TPR) repeat protein